MFGLTIPQQNIWNLQKYYAGTSISNNCGAFFFGKLCDHNILNRALNKLIELQEGLRLQFREENGVPMQYAVDYAPQTFPTKVFSTMEEFDAFAQDYAQVPFDLIDTPMYRFVIFDAAGQSGVLLCASHLITDAWAYSIIIQTGASWYEAFSTGGIADNRASAYSSFAESEQAYLHSERYEKDKSYWAAHYTARPEISFIKPGGLPANTTAARRFTATLSAERSDAINRFYTERHISQAVLFEAALILYLSRINPENSSVTLGIPVLNRSGAAEKRTVGMCISTTPLTIPVSKEDTAFALCQEISRQHVQLFRHQRFPYSHILRDLHERFGFTGNLYDVIVSFQNAKTGFTTKTSWYSNGHSEVGLEFHIDNRDSADRYTLNLDYQLALFPDEREIGLLVKRVLHIMDQIIETPEIRLDEVSILPKEERDQTLDCFNQTNTPYDKTKCVHTLFAEQAANTPDKIALVFEGDEFTYRQLDEMSNSLAHFLREKGVAPGSIVPIISRRSWHVIVAMLGVLKAGGAYMPVDPSYPADRIRAMLDIAQCQLALTCGYADSLGIETIGLETFDFCADISPVENRNASEDLCYIIFTSGSTGTPKGVSICHRNVVNYAKASGSNTAIQYVTTGAKSIVSTTNIIFDIFVTESLMPLLNGITIHFSNDRQAYSQKELAQLIRSSAADVLQTTPTKMRSYMMDRNNLSYLRNLKAVILGGEALPSDLLLELRHSSNAKIFNIYGPAETTVWSTNKLLEHDDITIGKPIANTQIYILDQNQQLLPIGVAGELCISGDGVGKGYLNRPDLTAERFLPDPFRPGQTMYRTGDLARWRMDGEIEYLGRIDTQVKIRGLRIELGEIESIMSSFDGIGLAAVTDKRDENGRQYLVGYYTAEAPVDESALRRHLTAKLPQYMVPNFLMHLPSMPMTPSGKTDRKNLPDPNFSLQHRIFHAPETTTEQLVARVWAKLLNISQVGKDDDFFGLGGDSLLAIHMASELEDALGVSVTVKDIMEHPDLEQFSAFLDGTTRITKPILPSGKQQYQLLPQQMAIYMACSKEPSTLSYNMPTRITLPADVDRTRLEACILQLPQLHPELNTCIRIIDGVPTAAVDPDARLISEHPLHEQQFVRPFALDQAPLFRFGFTDDALLFDMHHIIADGESLNIILKDLADLYAGHAPAASKIRYADYAHYFHSADHADHMSYFRDMLKCDHEPMALPEKKAAAPSSGISRFYRIDRDTFERTRSAARRNKLTDTMFFLGAFGILLSKFTGRTDVLSSVVLSNRTHAETARMIGMFVNTLPVSLHIDGTAAEYLAQVRELVLSLYDHQELPFLMAAEAAGMQDKGAVNTSFVYQADGVKHLTLDQQTLVPAWIETGTSKFDLTFEVTPDRDSCSVRIEYDTGKYDDSLIDRLFDGYVRILEQLESTAPSSITVISPEEREKMLFGFNDTAVTIPAKACVHELFNEQAAKMPEGIALVFEGREFTYRQLDEMSNSLAHFLREKGVAPGSIVPIISRRSWHVIVAMLGILKAGGAYMPVDPSYPADRIRAMLDIAQCQLALTCGYADSLGIETVCLETFDFCDDITPVENRNASEDLCYIIFTSGSTGTPKGVSICHRNVVNYCNYNAFNVCGSIVKESERIVSVTNTIFDIFVTESLLPLLNGVTIYLANEDQAVSQKRLSELIDHSPIDVIQTTPTKMRSFIMDKQNTHYLKKLSSIILGGEALPIDLYEELRRYTDAQIFNIYGPAETTVWSTNKCVTDPAITIGKPIANTQVYILDQNQQLLPIGVAGELCISGDGVGKGYLNRPDLTAERFLPEPFRPGQTMYRTGDLARWRMDGEIEYLGRIDTQVKIRGLRIELGEIESIMSSFDGIGLAAVTDKRDENGRQYLVGYYTAEAPVDETALRRHLTAKLPQYMVPNFLMHLPSMPMTPSGKTDRKNLPTPELTPQQREYVAPETASETVLCGILGELLSAERVGVTDDFFELGGDSLCAIEYVAQAHNQGIEIALQNVFDYPTVRGLCAYLGGTHIRKAVYDPADFVKYEPLLQCNVIDKRFVPVRRSLGNVFLTGATGFLGAHILDRYLREESGTIYCLVRGGAERLKGILDYYFDGKYNSEMDRRIIVLDGDITEAGLCDRLPDDIQTVIHTAATVKHYGPWDYFHGVNVRGTENIIACAKKLNAKLLHISTISVSGNSLVDAFDVLRVDEPIDFTEANLFVAQPLDNVYIRSKFEAERAVLDAALDGLDAKIIRVGNLTNRLSDFRFQPNYHSNAFLNRVRAALSLGALPDYMAPLYAEFSPIDQTAEGVLKIGQYADRQTVFHLNSHRNLYFDRMVELLNQLEVPMQILPGEAFNTMLQQMGRNPETAFIYEALQNDMDDTGKLVYDSNIHIRNEFTVWFLEKLGFRWAEIDLDYVAGYIHYFRELGYFS